jgi:hypothetical protein
MGAPGPAFGTGETIQWKEPEALFSVPESQNLYKKRIVILSAAKDLLLSNPNHK